MDDTTVDAGCPAHGDGTPICTCGELEALDRLRAERDALAAAAVADADELDSMELALKAKHNLIGYRDTKIKQLEVERDILAAELDTERHEFGEDQDDKFPCFGCNKPRSHSIHRTSRVVLADRIQQED